jgi:hypothetical protein
MVLPANFRFGRIGGTPDGRKTQWMGACGTGKGIRVRRTGCRYTAGVMTPCARSSWHQVTPIHAAIAGDAEPGNDGVRGLVRGGDPPMMGGPPA